MLSIQLSTWFYAMEKRNVIKRNDVKLFFFKFLYETRLVCEVGMDEEEPTTSSL